MNRQAFLAAAAVAAIAIGAPSLARADANADIAQLKKDQDAYTKAEATLSQKGLAATADDIKNVSNALAAVARDQQAVNIDTGNLAPTTNADSPPNNCAFKGALPDQHCMVVGAFTVPFKAELTRTKDVYGSASINGFVGMNLGFYKTSVTAIGFAGYSANLTSTNSSGTTNITSANTGAISYGVGVLFPIGGTYKTPSTPDDQVSRVHVGVVIGFDHTTSAIKYPYNDRPWISILVGTSF
jgi:hypothetical protein